MTLKERFARLEATLERVDQRLEKVVDKHEARLDKVESSTHKMLGVVGVLGVIWPQIFNWFTGHKQ